MEPAGDRYELRGRGGVQTCGTAAELVSFLAYAAQWRDDREAIRERVGWHGPASDVAEGPRADALRWLAGQGPAVERLPRAVRRWGV